MGLGLVLPAPAFREPEGALQQVEVARVYHVGSNRASTYSSAENGTRSPIPSPTPT